MKFDEFALEKLYALVESGIQKKISPGFAVGFLQKERIETNYFGNFTYDISSSSIEDNSLFDLASLTKVFTATCILLAISENKCSLESNLKDILPSCAFEEITIRQLLTHTSGLRLSLGSQVKYGKIQSMQNALNLGFEKKHQNRVYYSDQGYYLLGLVLEKIYKMPLDQIMAELLFVPLGMKNTLFCPSSEKKMNCVPTEIIENQIIQGKTHNEFTRLIGGVAGHAGLFSNLGDLLLFGKAWLNNDFEVRKISNELYKGATVSQTSLFVNDTGIDNNWNFGYGWRVDCRQKLGSKLPKNAIEITGFTGGQITLIPDENIVIVILSNRTYPKRGEKKPWEAFQAEINNETYTSEASSEV